MNVFMAELIAESVTKFVVGLDLSCAGLQGVFDKEQHRKYDLQSPFSCRLHDNIQHVTILVQAISLVKSILRLGCFERNKEGLRHDREPYECGKYATAGRD
jgi:hypothetical protein